MKRNLIISAFGDLISQNSRLYNIYSALKDDYMPLIITMDFNHATKKYKETMIENSVYTIHVPSYKKNLSIKRMYSHLVFAYKLHKYLNGLSELPDFIYCAMPTSTSALVCGRFCKKHGVRFIIDVIDLWPESLIPVLNQKFQLCFTVILYPWKKITQQAYKYADVILGESIKYTKAAHNYNPLAMVMPLYLGVDKQVVASLIDESKVCFAKPDNEIWIAYGGSLGTSYDFDTLIKSVAFLNGKYKYKLLFVGDGVSRSYVEKLIVKYAVNATVTGFLKYKDYLKYLSFCDIAINIFREGTKVVHSYKFNDYVATNCFILNSLEGETADMISEYKIGLNFNFKDCSLQNVLEDCCKNWDKYKAWKGNNERLITELLDKKNIYSKMVNVLR